MGSGARILTLSQIDRCISFHLHCWMVKDKHQMQPITVLQVKSCGLLIGVEMFFLLVELWEYVHGSNFLFCNN